MLEEKDTDIIIDSSSIIALYKLNLIDALKDLYNSVNVPEAVLSELGHDLPHWIKILPVNDINKAESFRKKLGDGESEVINWPFGPGCGAVFTGPGGEGNPGRTGTGRPRL